MSPCDVGQFWREVRWWVIWRTVRRRILAAREQPWDAPQETEEE